MAHQHHSHAADMDDGLDFRPQFSREGESVNIPRRRISAESVHPETAYQIIRDELMLDGNARLNVATFVTTWMEPEADRLMQESAAKNMIDKDEYPQTAQIEERCLDIIADLWHVPSPDEPIGCSTTGSSEACMLAGLAMKWHWRDRNGIGANSAQRPNLVMGANVQVCWLKFCRYWDVEARTVPVRRNSTVLHPDDAAAACDENTIGVVAILGSTFDGAYEDVKGISEALDSVQRDRGLDIPIHVDAASGGFVAPFLDEDLEWDFRLRRVISINASGSKYGLVYPGVGWLLWRDELARPEDLVFRVDYLGGDMPTMALNFSRPGAQVVAQYYCFLRLGHAGYCRVQQHSRDVATHLAGRIAGMGTFDLISDGSELPVVAFCLKGAATKTGRPRKGSVADKADFSVHDISDAVRKGGWQVPAYSFCADREDLDIMRIVVRNGFSRDMADMLLADLDKAVRRLSRSKSADKPAQAFRH